MIRLAFERFVKASPKGTPVPRQPGLKLFSNNRPCAKCGIATNLELDGARICSFDWRMTLR